MQKHWTNAISCPVSELDRVKFHLSHSFSCNVSPSFSSIIRCRRLPGFLLSVAHLLQRGGETKVKFVSGNDGEDVPNTLKLLTTPYYYISLSSMMACSSILVMNIVLPPELLDMMTAIKASG